MAITECQHIILMSMYFFGLPIFLCLNARLSICVTKYVCLNISSYKTKVFVNLQFHK
jgi:hypothetical protein